MSVSRAAADGVSDGGLVRSWPSSPLSATRQVTARLYSSLQHSRQQEVKGHAADRQVSFALSSPDLTAVRTTSATPPLLSDRLEELSLDSASSHDVMGIGEEGVESDAEEVGLQLLKSLRSAQPTSGRKHIEEMESVRTHLQSILRPTQTTADRHDFLTPASQHFLDDSHESDATSRLLSGVCVGGVEELFPRYSRLHSDVSCAVSELQVLRDSLERERERRKVCEQQVASLQSKVLQFQQQLTLAVAADRKKDIMIEQLDKTLVKVVEGWKRHDQERNEEMKRLQEEKETAEKTHNKHAQALSRVEQNLSEVEETLKKEQKHNQELQKTNKRLEQEASDLRVHVEDLQQDKQKLSREADKHREQLHKLQTESHDTRTNLQQQIKELQQHTQELQQQLHTHTDQLKQEVSAREEAESRTRLLQEELETTRRERETLRIERALEQTQFEAQKSQMEAEFRLSLEQQISERVKAVQEENNTYNTQLRQQHRKQLLDLSARQERELAAQLDQCRTQLQERDDKLQHLTQAYQHRLSEMQEQLVSMAATKKKLESQREELVSRLQGMMRSHWAEALRLLTNQEQMESFLSPVHQRETSRMSSSPKSDPHVSAAPQAVVLHLSREKEQQWGTHRELNSEINCSNTFSPLEPQLDNTELTALSDCSALWVRPMFTIDESMKEQSEERRETQSNLKHNLNYSQCEPKLKHSHTDAWTNHNSAADNVQGRGGASVLKQSHAPSDTWTNNSSAADSGLGRGGASVLKQSHAPLDTLTIHSSTADSGLARGGASVLKQSHTPSDQWANHSSTADSGLGRGGVSVLKQSNAPSDTWTNHCSAADSGLGRGVVSVLKKSHAPSETWTNNGSAPESGQSRGGVSVLKQSHALSDTWTNHSSTADGGRGWAYSSGSEKAPPLSDEAPPSRIRVSEDRQSELQYYVSKLLERSPGEPLDEPIREQRSESADASVQRHMTDLTSNMTNKKPEQHDKQEVCVSSQRGRSVQSRRSVNRRGGSQRVWR
nr:centrobin isoform X1 [Danio rerio]|eukprot:XP_021325729.1 centrobin isoform X1 [Danio rerio]